MRVGNAQRWSVVETLPAGVSLPPLLAIPSGPGFSRNTILPWLGGLTTRWQVSAVDLPGSGDASLDPAQDFSWSAFADDLEQVRAHMGGEPVSLLGHGWGAAMAVEYALAHPEAVAALILINPIRLFAADGQDAEAQARAVNRTDPTLFARWASDVAPGFMAALNGEERWDQVENNPWWGEMVRTQLARPTDKWTRAMEGVSWRLRAYATYKGAAMFDPSSAMAKYDLALRAAQIECPMLIIASGDDANYVANPEIHARPIAANLPHARLEIVEGCGHFLFADDEASFCRLVLSC